MNRDKSHRLRQIASYVDSEITGHSPETLKEELKRAKHMLGEMVDYSSDLLCKAMTNARHLEIQEGFKVRHGNERATDAKEVAENNVRTWQEEFGALTVGRAHNGKAKGWER